MLSLLVKKHPGPLRRRVRNPLNSRSGSARLADLDWSNWFEDRSGGACYLHVRRNHPEFDGGGEGDETWHRVFPVIPRGLSRDASVRLAMQDGELWWLFDRAPAKSSRS